MADRIKGITVVLGGDTTGLSKALSGVNKDIGNTQKQLKDVERLLKLDPTNTELLAQKQRLLAKALESTSSKVKELKKAADSLTVDDKKYAEWKKALANIQGQSTKTENEISKLQKELSGFKVGTQEYDSLLAKLDKCKEKYAELQKKASDTFEALGRPIGQNEYDALMRELAEATQEEKRLKEAAEKSNVALQKIGETAKKIASGTDKLADGVDKLNEKAKIASAAVVGGATLAVKSVSDIDSAVGSFMAQTGSAESQTDAWREALENIYKGNYGENFEDIANSMATVQKTLDDVDPSNIELLTEDAIALRDTFGYEVNESTRAAKALMDNFGVSAHQAFNLIATGAQNGLDYSGELLDTISEYSVQFGKVGFSADDFFNIMQSGSQNSAFNLDKVGDAIKELSIRVIDGSETTQQGFDIIGLNADEMAQKFAQGGDTAREAFDQTIAALAAMEDPVQQNIAGVDLFGTMWEDLGSTATLALGDISDSAYAAKDNLEKIKEEKYENLINDLQEVGRTIKLDILAPLGEQLMPIIDDVVGKASELVAAFAGMSTGQQQVVLAVAGIVAALPLLLSFVSGFLSVIGTVSSGIALFTGAIPAASAAATGFATVLKAIAAVFGGISTVVTGLFSLVTGTVIPAITAALQGLFAFIVANPVVIAIAAIVAAVVGLAVIINQNAEAITAALQGVNDFLTGIFALNFTEIFDPFLGEVINGFMANFQNLWSTLYTILNGIITFITGVFSGNWKMAWEGIKQVFVGIIKGLATAVKAPFNAIIGLINGVINGVNMMIDGLNSIQIDVPEWVPGFGGQSFGFSIPNIPNVPYLAKGGTVLSGSAIVGEAGPELLTVGPNGTQVMPLSGNERSLAGAGITIQRMNFYGYTAQEGRTIARQIDIELGRLL